MKKIKGTGYPDSKNVKEGAKRIKFHLDYIADLLDNRRWLAGNTMSMADFSAAAQIRGAIEIRKESNIRCFMRDPHIRGPL